MVRTNLYTDQCEIHHTLGETQHITFACDHAEDEQKELMKKIIEIIVRISKEKDPKIEKWWENNSSSYRITEIEEEEDAEVEENEEEEESFHESESDEDSSIFMIEKEKNGPEKEIINDLKRKREDESEDENENENEKKKMRKSEILIEKNQKNRIEQNEAPKPKLRQTSIFENLISEEERKNLFDHVVEIQKLGNNKLKRKREKATENRKRIKRTKKTTWTELELGSRGYITKGLVNQILVITKNDKTKTENIITQIHIAFLNYVQKMQTHFWDRHKSNLENEGIDGNVIYKTNRNNGVT